MYSALVGHDIDSLYLSSSVCLFPSASLILVNLRTFLLFALFLALVFAHSLFQPLGVFSPGSLSVWSVLPLLSWRQSDSLLPTSVCPENQTEQKCCLMIWLETACSVTVGIKFHLFFSSFCVSACLLFRLNSLVTLLSRIS